MLMKILALGRLYQLHQVAIQSTVFKNIKLENLILLNGYPNIKVSTGTLRIRCENGYPSPATDLTNCESLDYDWYIAIGTEVVKKIIFKNNPRVFQNSMLKLKVFTENECRSVVSNRVAELRVAKSKVDDCNPITSKQRNRFKKKADICKL